MKAQDLMIGDWVAFPEGIGMVIHFGTEFIIARVDEHERMRQVSKIKPISLTAEILEKNGFVKVRDFVWEYRTHNTCIKYEWHDKILVEITNQLTKKDKHGRCNIAAFTIGWLEDMYVHELQHALRLCGIEKEIVL